MRYYQPIILILLLTLCWQHGKSQEQTDDFTIHQDTCLPTTVEEYDRLVRFFRESSEEKRLFKINLLELAHIDLDLSYERRIADQLNLNLSTHLHIPNSYSNPYLKSSHYLYSFQAEFKYFNRFKGKEQEGHIANAFSGFYGTAGIGTYLYEKSLSQYVSPYSGDFSNFYYSIYGSTIHNAPYQRVIWKTSKNSISENILFLKLGYGYQYRLGSIGFISGAFRMGLGSNYSFSRVYLMPELEAKISFAISSFKRKKL